MPSRKSGDTGKGKKVDPRAKKPSGRSAPKRIEKPFRLEVGKTYETRDGRITNVVRKTGHPVWPFEGVTKHAVRFTIVRSYKENGRWLSDNAEYGGDLVREAPGAKRPRAASAKGSRSSSPKSKGSNHAA